MDSFTKESFKGNPAGVCFVEGNISDDKMLSIAQELNLSETAFIKKTEKENIFSIRYFSPIMEIPLCGHATLASAKIIFNQKQLSEINFVTEAGINLKVGKEDDNIIMEFPIYNLEESSVSDETLNALKLENIIYCGYCSELKILMLEISDTQILAELKPDFHALKKSQKSINGISISSRSNNDGYDFHSRFFWPWSGGEEDPVTGGTHTFLSKYWMKKLGKKKMKSFQSSKRTGQMDLEIINENKVLIKSQAVIILEGNILA